MVEAFRVINGATIDRNSFFVNPSDADSRCMHFEGLWFTEEAANAVNDLIQMENPVNGGRLGLLIHDVASKLVSTTVIADKYLDDTSHNQPYYLCYTPVESPIVTKEMIMKIKTVLDAENRGDDYYDSRDIEATADRIFGDWNSENGFGFTESSKCYIVGLYEGSYPSIPGICLKDAALEVVLP